MTTLNLKRRFNRSADHSYDRHAQVQQLMARQLLTYLNSDHPNNTDSYGQILEVGCGTGAFTERILKELPHSSITALDIAPNMINAAQKRIYGRFAGGESITFVEADVEDWTREAGESGESCETYDLIISNACFQWFKRPCETLCKLRSWLKPGGLLVFSTFGPHTFFEMHDAFNQVYTSSGLIPKRHGLTFTAIDQWRRMLANAGLDSIRAESCLCEQVYSTPRDFLHSVQGMGANASEASSSSEIPARRLFQLMYEQYKQSYELADGTVPATFDLVYILAKAQ